MNLRFDEFNYDENTRRFRHGSLGGVPLMARARTAEELTPNPLDVYRQVVGIVDVTPNQELWVVVLTEGGHTTTVYVEAKSEVDERARAIFNDRGLEV